MTDKINCAKVKKLKDKKWVLELGKKLYSSTKNGTKFSVQDKEEFISKLGIAHKEVSEKTMNSNFEIGNK